MKLINFCFIFSLPTDVQAEAIPLILGGGDVLMVICLLEFNYNLIILKIFFA